MCVPVSPSSPRRKSARCMRGSAQPPHARPLTVNETCCAVDSVISLIRFPWRAPPPA
ncbi:Uncharacterised protein [Bordetella pertussis]|nr:Uncharacterised protein [Bordetella pertussis]